MPGFTGAVPFSSIHPLKTQPNPPSPRRLSGLKFLVAIFRSLKANFRSRVAILSSSSSLEVEELLSAILVVVDDIIGAGWSLLVPFVDLFSAYTYTQTRSMQDGFSTRRKKTIKACKEH